MTGSRQRSPRALSRVFWLLSSFFLLSESTLAANIPAFHHDSDPNAQTVLLDEADDHVEGPVPYSTDEWPDADSFNFPSWYTSALVGRRLLSKATVGTLSTVFPGHIANPRTPAAVAGLPIPLPDYIADCEHFLNPDTASGNPTILALNVGTTFRNVAAGSNISLSIDWWSHVDRTEPIYPGFPLSAAGLPRAVLLGHLEPFPTPIDPGVRSGLEMCFLKAHPDAAAWLPESPNAAHSGYWAKLIVEHVYWVGGFGDRARIGWMNMTEWKGIRYTGSLAGVGDGRGWRDIKLPGEGTTPGELQT